MTGWPDLSALAWPLVVLVLLLSVLHRLREDLRPVFRSLIEGLAVAARANAPTYAAMLGFGLSASLSGFWDVFHVLGRADLDALSWHQYAALWTKVLNPFIVAVLAYGSRPGATPPPSLP
jgi:hypothetical protein